MGLVHVSYSLPKQQTVKLTFFPPCFWKNLQQDETDLNMKIYSRKIEKLFYILLSYLFFLDDIKWSIKEWRFFLCHIIDQFIIETSTELLDVDRFWNTSDEFSFKCFKNSFLPDRVVYYSHAVVLCCYCFISFLTSCVPNETKYPSLSYLSKLLFNALGNETATSKTNIMKTVYTHG